MYKNKTIDPLIKYIVESQITNSYINSIFNHVVPSYNGGSCGFFVVDNSNNLHLPRLPRECTISRVLYDKKIIDGHTFEIYKNTGKRGNNILYTIFTTRYKYQGVFYYCKINNTCIRQPEEIIPKISYNCINSPISFIPEENRRLYPSFSEEIIDFYKPVVIDPVCSCKKEEIIDTLNALNSTILTKGYILQRFFYRDMSALLLK